MSKSLHDPDNITAFKNYDECPVRTIGICEKWRLGHEPNYDEVNAAKKVWGDAYAALRFHQPIFLEIWKSGDLETWDPKKSKK